VPSLLLFSSWNRQLRTETLIREQVTEPKVDSKTKTKTASVSLVNDRNPSAYMTGFLLKSFDLTTGAYIGKFSNLPPNTELFTGCPVAEAAVHHTEGLYLSASDDILTLEVQWPSDRELGFAFFPVQSLYVWHEVYGSTTGLKPRRSLHNLPLYEGFFGARLGEDAWVFLYLGTSPPLLPH